MKRIELEYEDSNNNSDFLIEQIQAVQLQMKNCIWMVSDLDLIPVFEGDYSGVGGEEKYSCSYELL